MADSALAVFSDVHSNLEALQAVIADMNAHNVSRYVCLGDVVGYGADPVSCLERGRSLPCPGLMGNHDEAAASEGDLENMNLSARAGIEFARRNLSPEQRDWLSHLPLTFEEDDCEFVHGSLDAPSEWWYVISPEDVSLHFEAQSRPVCFCGHTHDPMFWHWNGAKKLAVRHGEGRISIPAEGKTLINTGSVGQPRDRNPDASYAIFNPAERWVEFRRVSYNIAKTKRKIIDAMLPRFTADRLSAGR